MFRDQDIARKEQAEARNRLEGLMYTTRRSVDEYGSTLSVADEAVLRSALQEAEAAVDANDPVLVERAHQRLVDAGQKLAEAIYAAVAADPGMAGIGGDMVDDEG
ncbi:MAG TPA: Hsp70 family protein, partial [Myxococcota bacterium]|nr:Hsp70 family protein [Myxococcota bacterium]